MGRHGTRGFTAAERRAVWTRFKAGESFASIAQLLGKHYGSVQNVVAACGGITPPVRTRASRVLTSAEREAISRGMAAGRSLRAIAAALGRAPSTISREVARHSVHAQYRAVDADRRAWRRAQRPKECRLAQHGPLRRVVAMKLAARWSPQQIAGWLRRRYPDDSSMQLSHETIYRTLFLQARGALKKELQAHLRSGRTLRRGKPAPPPDQRGQIPEAVSIAERPATVEDRAVPGHWEGDLIVGAKHSYIATLVERRSRYVHLVHVRSKHTATVVNALIREVQQLPAGVMESLTWDRGHEMAQHRRFAVATDVAVYFCDPRSPWQRGTNENTNGLLRQYFPRGTDLSGFSQRDLNRVARELNTRPRKTLGYRTPADILADTVAPTD